MFLLPLCPMNRKETRSAYEKAAANNIYRLAVNYSDNQEFKIASGCKFLKLFRQACFNELMTAFLFHTFKNACKTC